ncbi:hypothetical protein HPB49_005524 [Dermacentor silvarum]|uniref:Uncharacterized protein n=1 Tax=Dermacentor silvarum TaxID=543639 RepID=A0ACB8DUZ7_DERSI|nr:hypothetical protein HPB49_005524 [Dermacentor silvarum]
MKDEPISVTINESSELRGRPAMAVLATFYDDKLPVRRTLMIDLQIVQQCNAVSIGMLIQTALQKVGKTSGNVAVLCSDSAFYMQKLHKDLQLSNPEFKKLDLKDPCHLLNNALEDGIRTSSFNVVHDFVVHFPAMLKSSRELRRKFGLVCLAMRMTTKSLKSVCLSRWFSFYEALEDILDYWHVILSFLRSDEAKGTKCEKLRSLVSSPEAVHDLLVKMRFLKTNVCAMISIIKELEAESTMVHQVYPILAVRLHALISQWWDPTEVFASDVTNADPTPLLAVSEICGVDVKAKSAPKNVCTGVIFGVDPAFDCDTVAQNIASSAPIVACTRSGRNLVLKFAGSSPPQEIALFKQSRPVRPRRPRPLQCTNCGKYGHVPATCTEQSRCLRCGDTHNTADCKAPKPKRINCGGRPIATEPRCPRWQHERKVSEIKAASPQPISLVVRPSGKPGMK